jgi:hypothetical protein
MTATRLLSFHARGGFADRHGPVTSYQPSIAWNGSAVIIAANDTAGHLDYWWQAAGTAPWNQQAVA